MQQILVYGDSLTWGIIPHTRRRLSFEARWPGVMERDLAAAGQRVRVIEQRFEVNSPLALVIVMLGTNDFQAVHRLDAWHSAQGLVALVRAIRRAPLEPGMPVPPVLLVAPPPPDTPAGDVAPKFLGAGARAAGCAEAYERVAREEACRFFDAGTVIGASFADGVHLDADQHAALGHALATLVESML